MSRKMTKAEREFLKRARGPREKMCKAVITLHFLSDPTLNLEEVAERVFTLLRGNLLGTTMDTKRLPTHLDLTEIDL